MFRLSAAAAAVGVGRLRKCNYRVSEFAGELRFSHHYLTVISKCAHEEIILVM